MSIFKVQLLIFVMFCFFLKSQGLEALEKKFLILVTKFTIRNITDELFKTLNFKSKKLGAKLHRILVVHNYHEDDKILNEMVRLSKADNSVIKSETENLMVLLNEILNEDSKVPEYETVGLNDNETIQNVDKYLIDVYGMKEKFKNSQKSLNNTYNNLHVNNEFFDIMTSDDPNNLTASHINEKPAKITGITNNNNTDEYWIPQSRRIFQGERTFIKYFPFMASVHILNIFQCGGSIINSDLVITAASCLQLAWNNQSYNDNVKLLSVRVGSNFYSGGGKRIAVTDVYFHPEYNSMNLRNNIALLKLEGHMIFKNNKLKKIDFDRSANPLTEATNGITVIGWGARDVSNNRRNTWSNQVNYAVIDLYTYEECEEIYSSEYITENNFCAGFTTKGSGACNHDVGGPGIVGGLLVGIMSFGSPKCGTPDAPTVFEKVGFHADWIQQIINLDTQKPAHVQYAPVQYSTPASYLLTTTFKTPHFPYPNAESVNQPTSKLIQNLRTVKEDHNDIMEAEGYNKSYLSIPGVSINLEAKVNDRSHVKEQRVKVLPQTNFTITDNPTTIRSNKYTVSENKLSLRYDDKTLEAMIVRLISDMNITQYTYPRDGNGKKYNDGNNVNESLQSTTLKKETGGINKDDEVINLLYISDNEKNSITFDDIDEIFKGLEDNMGGEEVFSSDRYSDMTFRSNLNTAIMGLITDRELKDLIMNGDDAN